ncbi:MAG: MarR family winged helix-turn-helix transcriptional regulator [Microbacterium sp.]
MYFGVVTTDDAASRIAASLARLRVGRGVPPFGRPPVPPQPPHHPQAQGGRPPFGPRGPKPEFGRSFARMRLLEVLAAEKRALSIGEIGEKLGIDQPRASRVVQTSVELGHVRREADPDDARRTLIALTDAGRALATHAHGAREDAVREALADFSDAEREQFADLLDRFVTAWPKR